MLRAARVVSTRALPQVRRALFSTTHPAGIKNVTVIGGGLMGNGITQVTAQAGYKVTQVDVSDELLAKNLAAIDKTIMKGYKKAIEKGQISQEDAAKQKDEAMANITTKVSAEEAVANADLVIEAVPENLQLKQKIFASLDKAAPKDCIFASNTSSLPIADIQATSNRGDKFAGLHFFNPVPQMKLLEVVNGAETSEATYSALCEYGKKVGKTTVKCKDTPGFIVNRLLVPYLFEAIRLYERGDASKEDIDTAMKLGAGYPMGPFTLADVVGLDTCKSILDGWHQKYPDMEIFEPSPTLNKLVEEGKLGMKSGEGFYSYKK